MARRLILEECEGNWGSPSPPSRTASVVQRIGSQIVSSANDGESMTGHSGARICRDASERTFHRQKDFDH